ncbi:MAG: hypothetical protein ACKESC_01880 [Candidatus Hodgkinia cicadicola]
MILFVRAAGQINVKNIRSFFVSSWKRGLFGWCCFVCRPSTIHPPIIVFNE